MITMGFVFWSRYLLYGLRNVILNCIKPSSAGVLTGLLTDVARQKWNSWQKMPVLPKNSIQELGLVRQHRDSSRVVCHPRSIDIARRSIFQTCQKPFDKE